MKFRIFHIQLILVGLFLSVIACDKQDEYEEVEVSVVNVTTYSAYKVGVRYTVENIGTKSISGWEIFLNVRMFGGAQLMVSESVYYTLSPGEISSPRPLETRIPPYYPPGSEARSAYLKDIDTW